MPVATFLYALAGISLAAFARARTSEAEPISVVRVAMILSGIAWSRSQRARDGVSSELGRYNWSRTRSHAACIG